MYESFLCMQMLARLTQIDGACAARRFSQLQSLAAWYCQAPCTTMASVPGRSVAAIVCPAFLASSNSCLGFPAQHSMHTLPPSQAAEGKGAHDNDTPGAQLPKQAQQGPVANEELLTPASTGALSKLPVLDQTLHQFQIACDCTFDNIQLLHKQTSVIYESHMQTFNGAPCNWIQVTATTVMTSMITRKYVRLRKLT